MDTLKTMFKTAWSMLLILVLYGVLQGSVFLSVGETYSTAGNSGDSLAVLQQENFPGLTERSPENSVLSLLNRRRDLRSSSTIRKKQLHSGDPLLKEIFSPAEKLLFCRLNSLQPQIMSPGLSQTSSNTPVRAGPETFLS